MVARPARPSHLGEPLRRDAPLTLAREAPFQSEGSGPFRVPRAAECDAVTYQARAQNRPWSCMGLSPYPRLTPDGFYGLPAPWSVGPAVSWNVDLLGAKGPNDLTRSTSVVTKAQQRRRYTWQGNPTLPLGRVFRLSIRFGRSTKVCDSAKHFQKSRGGAGFCARLCRSAIASSTFKVHTQISALDRD